MTLLKRIKKLVRNKLTVFTDQVVFIGVVLSVAFLLCLGVVATIISAPFIALVSAVTCLAIYVTRHE